MRITKGLLLLFWISLFFTSEAWAQFQERFQNQSYDSPQWAGTLNQWTFLGTQGLRSQNDALEQDTAYLTHPNPQNAIFGQSFEFELALNTQANNSTNVSFYYTGYQPDATQDMAALYFYLGKNSQHPKTHLALYHQQYSHHDMQRTGEFGYYQDDWLSLKDSLHLKVLTEFYTDSTLSVKIDTGSGAYFEVFQADIDFFTTFPDYFGFRFHSSSAHPNALYIYGLAQGPVGTLGQGGSGLQLTRAEFVDTDSLVLNFNKEVDSAALWDTRVFSLNPGNAIAHIHRKGSQYQIRLQSGLSSYSTQLEINQLQSKDGQESLSTSKELTVYKQPAYRDILFSELYYSPSPNLPWSEEWVEMYNPGDQALWLDKVFLSDASTSSPLPRMVLDTQEVVIAGHEASILKDFSTSSVRTLPLSSWPTLNNDGDMLELRGPKGKIAHLSYEHDFHTEVLKGNAGYSLEVIDPEGGCYQEENFRTSPSSKGGTPGQVSAIQKRDLQAPEIVQAFTLSDRLLFLSSSEAADAQLSQPQLSIDRQDLYIDTVWYFDQGLKVYHQPEKLEQKRIEIQGLKDCQGNSQAQAVRVKQAHAPHWLDVRISEIYFNPPNEQEDFIELYNASGKALHLETLLLCGMDGGVCTDHQLISFPLVMEAKSYLVFTSSKRDLLNQFPNTPQQHIVELERLPAMNNTEGAIGLKYKGTWIDSVSYSEEDHAPQIRDAEGVSLERLNLKATNPNPAQWYSASEDAGWATPGQANSQDYGQGNPGKHYFEFSSDYISPNQDGYKDLLEITYHFPRPGFRFSISVFNEQGVEIERLTNNHHAGLQGQLYWDGTHSGSLLPVGQYILHIAWYHPDGRQGSMKKTIAVQPVFK